MGPINALLVLYISSSADTNGRCISCITCESNRLSNIQSVTRHPIMRRFQQICSLGFCPPEDNYVL